MDKYGRKFVDFGIWCDRCRHILKPENEEPCNECLHNATNLYSTKPVKFELQEESAAHFGKYRELVKVKPYLYEAWYRNFDYGYADRYFKDRSIRHNLGGCSSIRNGDFYGRQYDWTYDECAEFIVHTMPTSVHYASIGVCGSMANLTEEFVSSGRYHDDYRILPFMMLDGINECGVTANINVVPTDHGENVTIPTMYQRDSVCGITIVRYIMDHFESAWRAADYIQKHVSVYFPKTLHDMGYEVHVMIADQKSTYILEFIGNQTKVLTVSTKPYMTNFHLCGTNFNSDGTVLTPAVNTPERNAENVNLITPHGSGLERYNYICEHYSESDTKEGMRDLLNGLMYTKAYGSSAHPADPFWYTEFVGARGLTAGSPASDFEEVVQIANGYFTNRSRKDGGKTWQTVHSSLYDIPRRELYVISQEDGEELEYSL